MYIHCPECGFQNQEASNFCTKCGALLPREESESDTLSYVPDESPDPMAALADLRVEGTALVVVSGGGRAGETFTIERDHTTIGRSPEADVFLDDVTVSRNHAVVLLENEACTIEDLGSLNGTYVNRRRIESTELEDGDEVQIGKYRLTFLSH